MKKALKNIFILLKSSINVAEEAFRLQPAVHASYFQQGYLLGVRTFKIYMRDPLRFIVSLAQTILIAALVSLVFMVCDIIALFLDGFLRL